MIVCDLAHSAQYEMLHPMFAKAFAFLRENNFSSMDPGRIELAGTDLYALVQTYQTADPAQKRWETHKHYIDIQYVAEGTEICGWAPAGTLEPEGDYVPDKDIRYYRDSSPSSAVRLGTGFFAILMPEDIHRPGCRADNAQSVRKVVLKVRLSSSDK